MFNFLVNHWSTILVGAIVLLIITAILWKMVRDRKKGNGSCCGGCSGCPAAGTCHRK